MGIHVHQSLLQWFRVKIHGQIGWLSTTKKQTFRSWSRNSETIHCRISSCSPPAPPDQRSRRHLAEMPLPMRFGQRVEDPMVGAHASWEMLLKSVMMFGGMSSPVRCYFAPGSLGAANGHPHLRPVCQVNTIRIQWQNRPHYFHLLKPPGKITCFQKFAGEK